MDQLQADQAKKQKEASDDYMRRIANLNQQCMQQDEWYGELQQRLHVSESSAQSTILHQSHSNPSVSVRMPPSASYQLPPVPRPCMFACVSQVSQQKGAHVAQPHHPLIPPNALPQVPVVDFAQQ